MKLTIRKKFALVGIALAILTSVLLSAGFFYLQNNAVRKAFEDRSMLIIKSANFSLESFTNEFEKSLVELEGSTELKGNITEEEKVRLKGTMTKLMNNNVNILNIYFVTEDNKLIVSPERTANNKENYRERKWYKGALESKSFVWSDEYIDELTGKEVVTVSKAVYKDNKLQGVVGIDIVANAFLNYISNISLGNDSYFIILDSNNVIMSHPDPSRIGKKLTDERLREKVANSPSGFEEYIYKDTKKYAVYNTLPKTNWKIIGTLEVSKVYKEAQEVFIITLLIAIVVVIISAFWGMNLTNDLSKLAEKISNIGEVALILDGFDAKSHETDVIAKQVNKIINKINTVVEATSDAIWQYDVVNDKLFISKKFIDISGYDFTDRTKSARFILDLFSPRDVETLIFDYKGLINLKSETDKRDIRLRRIDGKYIWLSIRAIVGEKNDTKATIIYGAITDITDIKQRDEEVYNLAFYDTLTGLPNKRRVFRQLKFYIERSKEVGSSVAMVILNIDDFAKVNNTLGARVGDEYLKEVVKRLQVVNEDKHYYLGRVGGDDFAILIDNIESKDQVEALVNEVLKEFKKPLLIDGKLVVTSITLGISIYPEDGHDEEKIFRNADIAMSNAGKVGGKKYSFFKQDMYNSFARRMEIENCLRSADYDSEFKVLYQPQIDVMRQTIRGFEALIRWNSPTLGFVSPAEFIPISEEIGIIVPLGRWIIYRVFKDILRMKELGINFGCISINISAVQLMDAEFGAFIEEAIENAGINCSDIELEITETSVINNIDYSKIVLNKFKENGLKIVLDDFGTGYSSLSYLRSLPIGVLKIDKSFIDSIEYEGENRSLINGIIGIAHELNLEVVAEGVEDENQVGILKEMKCDSIQGYYFSKPISFEEVSGFYKKLNKV